MTKEELKEIMPLLLDGESAPDPLSEWQVSHSSSQKLHRIFGTKLESDLDRALVKLFPHYEDAFSLYGITSSESLIRYKNVLIYFHSMLE